MPSTLARQDDEFAGTLKNKPSVFWGLSSLCLSMLMSSLDTSIANAGLPVLAQAFQASFQAVQWIVLAYLLSITALIVSVGRLGDLTGRRRLLLAGIFLFTTASLLCGLAPTLWWLVMARAVHGLGAAIMLALALACISEIVPKEKIGSTMGLLGTMSAIGTTLGPSFGGLLMTQLGWQSLFLVNIPLGILNFLLAYRYLPVHIPSPSMRNMRFDHLGTLVLALTLTVYALAMTLGEGQFGVLNIVLLGGTFCGASLFVRIEAKAESPLIRLAMFRHPVLSGSLAMSMLVSTVIMSTLVVGPFYLSQTLGLEVALVGFILSVGPLVATLTGVPAGSLVDRWGSPCVTLIGLFGLALACLALACLPEDFGIAGYLGSLVCLTASYALFQASNNTALMRDLPPDQRGVISGMLNLSRHLGLITGAAMLGAVFALAVGESQVSAASPDAVASGMRSTFAVAAMLIVIAIIIALWVYRHHFGFWSPTTSVPKPTESSGRIA